MIAYDAATKIFGTQRHLAQNYYFGITSVRERERDRERERERARERERETERERDRERDRERQRETEREYQHLVRRGIGKIISQN